MDGPYEIEMDAAILIEILPGWYEASITGLFVKIYCMNMSMPVDELMRLEKNATQELGTVQQSFPSLVCRCILICVRGWIDFQPRWARWAPGLLGLDFPPKLLLTLTEELGTAVLHNPVRD